MKNKNKQWDLKDNFKNYKCEKEKKKISSLSEALKSCLGSEEDIKYFFWIWKINPQINVMLNEAFCINPRIQKKPPMPSLWFFNLKCNMNHENK